MNYRVIVEERNEDYIVKGNRTDKNFKSIEQAFNFFIDKCLDFKSAEYYETETNYRYVNIYMFRSDEAYDFPIEHRYFIIGRYA